MAEELTFAQRYLRWWAPVLAPTAGFIGLSAFAEPLGHRFDPASFIDWKEHLDERRMFETLGRSEKEELIHRLRSRLEALPPGSFVVPDPVVYVVGRRK